MTFSYGFLIYLMSIYFDFDAYVYSRLRSCLWLLPYSPDPGPVMFRARDDIFWCYAVLWFTEFLVRGPGSVYIWRYAVFGVMLCYDV